MKKTFISLLILIIILNLVACSAMSENKDCDAMTTSNQITSSTLQLLSDMKNNDVAWTWDYLGLRPWKFKGATLLLKSVQEDITSFLVSALVDENKFVAAHVLLTIRGTDQDSRWEFDDSLDDWNGLKVQLRSSSSASYEGNDLVELQKNWCKKLQQ